MRRFAQICLGFVWFWSLARDPEDELYLKGRGKALLEKGGGWKSRGSSGAVCPLPEPPYTGDGCRLRVFIFSEPSVILLVVLSVWLVFKHPMSCRDVRLGME